MRARRSGQGGLGRAPWLEAALLRTAWAACFADYAAFLGYCVPQDRAMSVDAATGRVTRREISLAFDAGSCVPLEGEVRSAAARAL